ncbi:MAG: chpE [Mycobacterium sp.]|nr:chpE [Mycobacterium sp.]
MKASKKLRLFAIAGIMVAAGLTLAAPSTANAASAARESFPVLAGSHIVTPLGNCTVGAIFRKSGLLTALSPQLRATRYAVTAKHCVSAVGDSISVGGTRIGNVIARDQWHDLALVKVDPEAHQNVRCQVTSFGPHCINFTTWTPRATGQVLLPSAHGEAAVPMVGSGAPAAHERFCMSGAVTGANCTHLPATVPAGSQWARDGVPAAALSPLAWQLRGDSGGPAASTSGKFYGIVTDAGHYSTEHQLQELTGYIPAATVLRDFSGYYLA